MAAPNPLTGAINELVRRLSALEDFYKQNPDQGPGSLQASALRSHVREQERFLGERFNRLNPQQQSGASPLLQLAENRRKEVEEQEIRRRKELNQQLQTGSQKLQDFVSGLAHKGGGSGLAGAGGFVAGSIAALVGTFREVFAGISRDVKQANPGLGSTIEASEKLNQAARGLHFQAADREKARSEQLQALYRYESFKRGERITDSLLSDTMTSARRFINDKQERSLRERGFIRPGENPIKENLPDFGIRARTTGAAEYETQLGNAALQSSGQEADMELLRRQMEQSNVLLERIAENTGRAGGPGFTD